MSVTPTPTVTPSVTPSVTTSDFLSITPSVCYTCSIYYTNTKRYTKCLNIA